VRLGKMGTPFLVSPEFPDWVAFKMRSEIIVPRGTPLWWESIFARARASGSRFIVVLIPARLRITHQMSSIKIVGSTACTRGDAMSVVDAYSHLPTENSGSKPISFRAASMLTRVLVPVSFSARA